MTKTHILPHHNKLFKRLDNLEGLCKAYEQNISSVVRHNDDFEDNEYMLLEYDTALNLLTFENTKEILNKANKFINTCKD